MRYLPVPEKGRNVHLSCFPPELPPLPGAKAVDFGISIGHDGLETKKPGFRPSPGG